MKSVAPLLLLTSLAAHASTSSIEPVLVPIKNASADIDIQMGKYEVTNAEFSRFVNDTGYELPEKCHLYSPESVPAKMSDKWKESVLMTHPYKPAVCTGTAGAIAYAAWLAESTGKPYRLAEDSEWHFAASLGESRRLAFGEDTDQTQICDYENIEDFATVAGLKIDHGERYSNSANCNDGAVYQTVVGMYRPNQFGLHDMIGNVREFLQTCHKTDEKDQTKCAEYAVAGASWHWQARSAATPDWIAPDFLGSIEGFRLVLDSNKVEEQPRSTKAFVIGLKQAQQKERKLHRQLKSIPTNPKGVQAQLMKGNKVEVTWLPVHGSDVTYSVYRSYLDPKGKKNRKHEKVAEGLTKPAFTDQLEEDGAASYQVFAASPIGESMASVEVHVGDHKIFTVGERIQAEHYFAQRHTHVRHNEQEQSIAFNPNVRHFVPTTMPFLPGWIKFNFNNEYNTQATLRMRVRSVNGAKFDIWQGHHLVGQISTNKSDDFVELETTVSLVVGADPIELRAADQNWFQIDWFEFSH